MVWRTAFNSGSTPVVVSKRGHQIGGGDWGPVETTEPSVKWAVDHNVLQILGDVPGDTAMNPAASAAAERTARYAERSEQMDKLSKEQLYTLALGAGAQVGPESDVLREDLEYILLNADVSLKAPKISTTPPGDEQGDGEGEE